MNSCFSKDVILSEDAPADPGSPARAAFARDGVEHPHAPAFGAPRAGDAHPSRRTPARHAITVLLGVIFATIILLSSCSREPASKEPVVTVQVTPAKRTTIERMVKTEAVLFPINEAAITPKISAPVAKFYVQRGERVHRGQLLAVLENKDLAAAEVENKGAYEQAEAAYESSVKAGLPEEWQKAEFEVQADKQTLDAAQKIYESRQNLFKQGALPRKELDQAEVAYTQARNQYELAQKHLQALQSGGKQQQLKAAEGQLSSAKGKYQASQAQLNYSEIRCPINGVVTDRPLYPGEMAAAGTPLITVMDLSQVVARAHIPQDQAALLKLGDAATITAPGTNEKIEGKVTVVSPALDPNSTTVEVWVQAANPGQRLRPGSNVHVSMLAGKIPDAIVVPASALVSNAAGEKSVMVVGGDGRAHQQTVKVGVQEDGEAQIAGGLKAGDNVISRGAYGLPDNSRVQVQAAPERVTQSGDGRNAPASKQE